MGIRNKITGEIYSITSYNPSTIAITGIDSADGNANLGDVSNVYIQGGNPGEVLTTNGTGNLSWAPAGGNYGNADVALYLPTYTGAITSLTGNVTTTANVNAAAVSLGAGKLTLSGNLISTTADVITIDPLGDGTPAGNVFIAGSLQVTGNITYNDIVNATTNDLQWIAANNAINTAAATGAGLAVGPLGAYASFTYNSGLNVWQSTLPILANGGVNANGPLTATTGVFSANVTAPYFIGNGSQLTGMYANANVAAYLPTYGGNVLAGNVTVTGRTALGPIGNVSITGGTTGQVLSTDGSGVLNWTTPAGTYANANVAAYLPTYTGALPSLTGNVTTTANIQAGYFIGNGSQLTGMYANANVASYLPTYTGALPSLTGNVTTTANIQADYFIGNGSQLTGMYANANVAVYLPTYTGNLNNVANITASGNVTASYLIGNGSQLTGMYSNANVANYLPIYTGNLDNVANITASGNVSAANVDVIPGGAVSFGSGGNMYSIPIGGLTGTVTVNGVNDRGISLTAGGPTPGSSYSQIQWVQDINAYNPYDPAGSITNWVYTQFDGTYIENFDLLNSPGYNYTWKFGTDGVLTAAGDITTPGNITAGFFIGDGGLLSNIATGSDYSNANVANYLPIYTGNLNNVGNIAASGNINTLGNINVSSGNVTVSGSISAGVIIGEGGNISNIAGANVSGEVSFAAVANSVAGANVSGQVASAAVADLATFATTANAVAGANVSGEVAFAAVANNVSGANVSGQVANALVAGTVYIGAQPNITSVGTLTSLNVTGNILAGNANVGNLIVRGTTTTANVTDLDVANATIVISSGANALVSNGAGLFIGSESPTVGSLTYLNASNSWNSSLLFQAPNFTTPGNVTGAHIIGEGGNLSNITAANITGTVASATVAASANSVAGANVSGQVAFAATANSVAGANVSGQVAFAATANSVAVANVIGIGNIATIDLNGDGTTVLAGNGTFVTRSSSNIANGTSNVRIATSGGNITFAVGGVPVGGISQNTLAIGGQSAGAGIGANSIALGTGAAQLSQGSNSVAIGTFAGTDTQGLGAIAIGTLSGQLDQSDYAVAIGFNAGKEVQGANSIAIGRGAGFLNQPANTIILNATGVNLSGVAGQTNRFYVDPVRNDTGNTTNAVYYNTTTKEVTYGPASGSGSSFIANGTSNVRIATSGGNITMAVGGVSVGTISQYRLAIGRSGGGGVGNYSIALGYATAVAGQGSNSVAIGTNSGEAGQAGQSVAIGYYAGQGSQGESSIAIGSEAAIDLQGSNAIAIGSSAGKQNQGINSIAIGRNAGNLNQPANTIILNATGLGYSGVSGQTDRFYVDPVRNDTGNVTNAVYYNTTTKEVTYGPAGGSGSSFIANGTSNVSIATSGGNITMAVAGVAVANITLNRVSIGGNAGIGANANTVAIGIDAGKTNQQANSVAIGRGAGTSSQGANSVAIGSHSGGFNQGANSVTIGANAQTAAAAIVLNASGANLFGTVAGFYVNPIRNDVANIGQVAAYNTTSREVTYTNTISLAGNITGGNITSTGNVSALNIIATNDIIAPNIGTVAPVNLNGDASTYLVGTGVWSASTTTAARRNITKISEAGIGGVLIVADGRLFSIKGGSGGYDMAFNGLGSSNGAADYANNMFRGVTNCYEIVVGTPTVGVTVVDAGSYCQSAYALLSNGDLYTWGYNNRGQLGLGDLVNRNTPQLSLTGVSKVFTTPSNNVWTAAANGAGANATKLIVQKTDGTVWACGYGGQGVIGLGLTPTDYSTWTVLPWIQPFPKSVWNLGNGPQGAMVVQQSNGTVWVCGNNTSGQLGLGNNILTPVATAVQTSLWTGGDNTLILEQVLYGGAYSANGTSLLAQDTHMFMLLQNSTTQRLLSAGMETYAQGGKGFTQAGANPTPQPPDTASGFSGRTTKILTPGAGASTAYCLQTNGDLWTWGYNAYGTAGNNTTTTVTRPYLVMTGVEDIYGDTQGSIVNGFIATSPVVKKTNGTLWAWGYNVNGEVGSGTGNNNELVPAQIKISPGIGIGIKAVSTCFASSVAGSTRILVTADNQLFAWGNSSTYLLDPVTVGDIFSPLLLNPPILTI